jgi:outer membrane protein assembly factor BamB
LDSWPEDGLKPKWVIGYLGEGYSSVIKVNDRLYINCLDADNVKKESVVCMDLNGKKIWQTPTGAIWGGDHTNPRVTPTYVAGEKADDARLFVLSGAGELFCLAAADGAVVWQKNPCKDYETQFGNWGIAENVVAKDGKVFVTIGGKKALAVAYNIADGSVAWESDPLDDRCAYVAPALYGDTLIVATSKYVSLLDTATGKSFWTDDFIASTGGAARMGGIHCNAPLIKGNQFFLTQGYGQGCAMYEMRADGKSAELKWGNKAIDTRHHGVVEVDGRIYGSNFQGRWCCVDWATGAAVYGPENWKGKGVTIFADGKLFMYAEGGGTVAVAKPGDKFDITSSFSIDFGTAEHWSHPVICDGVLYVRHGNTLAAFDIAKKSNRLLAR